MHHEYNHYKIPNVLEENFKVTIKQVVLVRNPFTIVFGHQKVAFAHGPLLLSSSLKLLVTFCGVRCKAHLESLEV